MTGLRTSEQAQRAGEATVKAYYDHSALTSLTKSPHNLEHTAAVWPNKRWKRNIFSPDLSGVQHQVGLLSSPLWPNVIRPQVSTWGMMLPPHPSTAMIKFHPKWLTEKPCRGFSLHCGSIRMIRCLCYLVECMSLGYSFEFNSNDSLILSKWVLIKMLGERLS